MSDLSICNNYLPSTYFRSVKDFPILRAFEGSPKQMAYIQAEGLLSGVLTLLTTDDYLDNPPAIMLRHNATLPNGYILTIYNRIMDWEGVYIYAENSNGSIERIMSHLGVDAVDNFDTIYGDPIRVMVVRPVGETTGAHRWQLVY